MVGLRELGYLMLVPMMAVEISQDSQPCVMAHAAKERSAQTELRPTWMVLDLSVVLETYFLYHLNQ